MTSTGRISAAAYMKFFTSGEVPDSVPTRIYGSTQGVGLVEPGPEPPPTPAHRQKLGSDYARHYQEARERQLIEWQREEEEAASSLAPPSADNNNYNSDAVSQTTAAMSRLDVDTFAGSELADSEAILPSAEQNTDVFDRYDMTRRDPVAAQLPIAAFRRQIVNQVEISATVVIEGATGCGKTTQVPQYLLEHWSGRQWPVNILVTQPRRLAAESVARRVSVERRWPLGSLVGYEIGLNKVCGADTRLTYCTTGVLLQKLVHRRSLHPYTHIILDEVHERDTDTDLALLLVRRLQQSSCRGVKVVLMSATSDTRLLSEYFALPVLGKFEPAPVLSVSGESPHRVQLHYLEELQPLAAKLGLLQTLANAETWLGEQEAVSSGVPRLQPPLYRLAAELIKLMDQFERSETGVSARHVQFGRRRGSVLIFLPGMHEIEEMSSCLRPDQVAQHWTVVPLHSLLTGEEQSRVFQPVADDQRKIIISTNMAESSITVVDIKYVIDFCLTKQLQLDVNTNYPALLLDWASKASCRQRAGRAGRVSSGRVYRLIPSSFYDQLYTHCVPEMLRAPLEHVIVRAKKFCSDLSPHESLALAPSPPDLERICAAIVQLKQIGALLSTGNSASGDGLLTQLGHMIATLPVDIRLARLIALGHLYGCLAECITIAAGLTAKAIFSRPFDDPIGAYSGKIAWADNTFSDCLALVRAHTVWQHHVRNGHFERGGARSERDWARANSLQLRCLHDMAALRTELQQRLEQCNIHQVGSGVDLSGSSSSSSSHLQDHQLILLVCLAGAFYPNYFVWQREPNRDREVNRALLGHSLHTTVCLSGLPQHCGALYHNQLLQQLRPIIGNAAADPRIHFDNTRAYVQFDVRQSVVVASSGGSVPASVAGGGGRSENVTTPLTGGVATAVYLACRLGQVRNRRLHIMRYTEDEEHSMWKKLQEMQRLAAERSESGSALNAGDIGGDDGEAVVTVPPYTVPGTDSIQVHAVVTHVEHPAEFYIRYHSLQANSEFERVHASIGRWLSECVPARQPRVGALYLAPYLYSGSVSYYRGRVERCVSSSRVLVYFVDFGNSEMVEAGKLLQPCRRLLAEQCLASVPAQAVPCRLAEVQPPRMSGGLWSPECISRFSRLLAPDTAVSLRVYSVCEGVVHADVLVRGPPNSDSGGHTTNVSDWLCEQGLAESCMESLASRQDHDTRISHGYSWLGNDNERAQGTKLQAPAEMCGSVHPSVANWLESRPSGALWHPLRGPDSPLAVTLSALPRSIRQRPVTIDPESVNTVLLDAGTHAENAGWFERVLVASAVIPCQSRVRAAATTLMPAIPGLPSLLMLLFAPAVELRVDTEKGVIVGALCGLGCDSEEPHHALYPDHDAELEFDVAIGTDDLRIINTMRMICWLTYLKPSDNPLNTESDHCVADFQRKMRSTLLQLLKRKREPLPQDTVERARDYVAYRWGQADASDRMVPKLDRNLDERLRGYLITASRSVELADKQRLRERVLVLLGHARKVSARERHYCPLCEVTTETPFDLLKHMGTPQHSEKEHDLFEQNSV